MGPRKLVETAAREAGVAFVGLWLEAPLPELEARIAGRQRDASDATVAVLRAASETHPDAADWTAIDALSSQVALSQARDQNPLHESAGIIIIFGQILIMADWRKSTRLGSQNRNNVEQLISLWITRA